MTISLRPGVERPEKLILAPVSSAAMAPVAQENDPARTCAVCRREKSIRGVWYLMPPGNVATPFMCESCFAQHGLVRAA